MSDQELKNTIDAMTSFRNELTSSREKARAYLIEAGIIVAPEPDPQQQGA